MTAAYLHEKLMEACENGNVEGVKYYLDAGANPNFNIKRPSNALDRAIQIDNHHIVELLLEHGAIIKELVLQKAIERDKDYLALLIPDFRACKDEKLLMGVLQAAMHIGDVELAKQAIHQGAKPERLILSALRDLSSTEILALLIENGFDIHAQNNMILSTWMGSSQIDGGANWKPAKDDLLAFIFDYYLEKPKSIEKFNSLRLPDKKRLFLMGLNSNNFNMMKFALMIGADKNNALNAAHRQYHAYKQGSVGSIYSEIYKKNKSGKIGYEIIEYILQSTIKFSQDTISRAVCFKYTDLLNALRHIDDLEYGYEMAYKYEDDDLLNYFSDLGVSKEAQSLAKMKVSAIKGNLKALRKAINEGAEVKELDTDMVVEVINANQIESLKYLYDAGVVFDSSLNQYLNKAMSSHKAYESISYLIEIGLDITRVKNIPREYKKRYPTIADMWEKRFRNIFDYTVYLAKEVHPKAEGKKKEAILKRVAELSTLPYVIKMSEEKSHGC